MKRKEDQSTSNELDIKKLKVNTDSNAWDFSINNANKNTHTVKANSLVITVNTTDLYSILPGRRSFGGFNPITEQNYQKSMEDMKFEKAVEKAQKSTISDEEMLKRYEGLIGLPRGPNQGKAKVTSISKQNIHNNHNNHNKGNGNKTAKPDRNKR